MTRLIITAVKEVSRHQVSRFLIVGVFSFLIEFCLFTVLVDFLHIQYTAANVPAMTVSVVCNYFLTKMFVFGGGRYNGSMTFVLFVVFTLFGLGLNQFFLWYLVEQGHVNIKLSKFIAVGLASVFNYFTKKYLVF
ncbi:putative flippase GtrA [Arcticibacter pallidicorallinus]|uniref:Putative flippase GtrA n=1 Tax=Arcticibacter pallidicorallinus TaxID=1259464 RepID=A0A2T0TQS6_9SPHI|nr:GtrA family protein [Arcticibacter pallidicorallinus]PRY48026.1 putative flippase GtrA [Arcticibacter pallidicorallinus]